MIINKLYLCLLFVSFTTAKFEQLYEGIAAYGLSQCIAKSSYTLESVTIKANCNGVFKCILDDIDDSQQTILSAGSAILGFIPTVLLLLGNTNEEIIRIHTRYPLLALWLSFTNVNKGSARFEFDSPPQPSIPSNAVFLGPYGVAGTFHPRTSSLEMKTLPIVIVHILAAGGAAGVIWQTIDLGRKAVLTWSCWTNFYPAIWLCGGFLHHIFAIVFLRLSLKSAGKQKGRVLTHFDLTEERLKIFVSHSQFAIWSKVFVDLLGNVNYLLGTVILSSLTLVSGNNAIKILVVYGMIASVSRFVAAWTLARMNR